MNFSQLKFVKATSETKSFSKAAQICHVTQPTLSNGVSKLEDELGERIFERTTRTVGLTSYGELLLPTILSILKLEKMIYLEAKEFSNPETVVLKVGMSPLLNTRFITLLTNSYKDQNSGIEILLIEDNLKELEEKLDNRKLDLIFVPVVTKTNSRNSMALYDEDLFLIDNSDGSNSKVQIKDMRDKTFVMVPDSCGLSEITRSLLRTTRKEVREYEGKALSYQVLADWASHGLGSAILPKSKIFPNISKQQIFSSNKAVKISFQAKWQARDYQALNSMIRHFRKNINEIARGIAE
jgi:DNA-binding transcriptional LysR family regulator